MKQITSLLFGLLLPAALAAQNAEDLTPSGDPAPLRAVKLIEAGSGANMIERVFFGQVAALETVDLSFDVGGRMIMFHAQEGQFLDAGLQLAALDPAPFERAAERARVQLLQAERNFERAQILASTNAGSTTQTQNAETARDLAAVALDEARAALEDTTLHAPFRALVASRLTTNFANLAPGQSVVRLHDMSEVRVEIDVPEQMFQLYATAPDITFTGNSPLFDGDVPLELREFNAETQSIGQSYSVTLALPDDRITPGIIPGASITVTARVSAGQTAETRLPPFAVTIKDGVARVLVYTPDASGTQGTVGWQPVTITSPNGTDITATGISPGTLIVAAGAQLLQEGEIVRPFTGLSVE